jgi:trimethylamine--corrinoid protein Co-methyltransferase
VEVFLIFPSDFSERIHTASLKILEAIGVRLDHSLVRDLVLKSGAKPGRTASGDYAGFRIMAAHTRKHLRPLMFTSRGAEPLMEMAQVLAAGRSLAEYPVFSLGYSIVSPFHWVEIPLSTWYLTRGHKIPVMINGEPIAGATSPMTLAGSIAQSNAEILSGIIINQLLEPGRPCVYNLGFAHVLDMRTTLGLSGSPECALMAAAGGKMAAYYNLPSASWMSTDSCLENSQASAEKMMTGLVHAQHGINLIWGVGQLESQKSISLAQCVIDNEIAGYVKHFIRGFGLDAESLALEEILAQNFQGNYLESEHTLRHFRDVLHFPEVFRRDRRGGLEKLAELDADRRAEQKVRDILSAPTAPILTPEQDKELEKIETTWNRKMG